MIVFIAYYELGLLVNRHTGSLIKQYCFGAAKVLLFHEMQKYPKLAFLVAHIAVIRYTQVPKKNTPHTMRDKEHRYDTRRRQIFLFPPLILRSETEQEKKHRAMMQNWRHLEGGSITIYAKNPEDYSSRF